jgi:putative serine protease PepD
MLSDERLTTAMSNFFKTTTAKVTIGFVLGATAVGGVATAAGTFSASVASACVDTKTNAIYSNPTGSCAKGRTSITLGAPAGSITGVVQKVSPSVVTVNVTSPNGNGTGSGVIYQSNISSTYIITNNHVIDSGATAGTIEVELDNGDSYPATIVGRDSAYDLAVIKINKGNQPTIVIGNSSTLNIGDQVIAFGSPLGLDHTVTSGIVSSLNRPVTTGSTGAESYVDAIQTDAAINPGNSGGALTDSEGKLVGINSAIATLGSSASSQSGSIGVGFSIPISETQRVIDEIIKNGKATRPFLGVTFDQSYTGKGAKIQAISAGEAAQKAGIVVGSIITKIDNNRVTDLVSAIVRIRSYAPGDKATITLTLPTGASKVVTVTLGSASTN